MQKEKVVVIIPTYNEEGNIAKTVHAIFEESKKTDAFQIEVLVFDSQSTDGTLAILHDLKTQLPHFYFIEESKKSGLGSAYLQGMRFAMEALGADIVFEFDADGSHKPCYLVPMLELLKQHDVVVGSRYIKGGSIPSNWGMNRKLLSATGNWIARLFITTQFRDITSGFRGTRVSLLRKVLPAQFLSNHYAYKLELYWLLYQAKASIVEFPIVFVDREQGDSKLPKNSIIDGLRVLFTLRFPRLKQYVTMCCVGMLGLFVQVLFYNALRHWQWSVFAATQTAMSAAILGNFALNSRYTFKHHQPKAISKSKTFRRLLRFACYSIVMIYFQSVWMYFCVENFGPGRIKENLALGVGIVIGSIINYMAYTKFIWKRICP